MLLGLAAIRAAFAIDHQAMALPVNLVTGQSGKLRDAQSSFKEGADKETHWYSSTCKVRGGIHYQ
jgi:hypothetical protein